MTVLRLFTNTFVFPAAIPGSGAAVFHSYHRSDSQHPLASQAGCAGEHLLATTQKSRSHWIVTQLAAGRVTRKILLPQQVIAVPFTFLD